MNKLILFIPLFFLSCGEDKFRKVEKLDGFRILAIEAASPEVAPGTTTNLRLFVSDPTGPVTGRQITGTVTSCIDPGISLGAAVSCDHDTAKVTNPFIINTSLADFTSNLGTGYTQTTPITVPSNIFVGRSLRDQSNGVGYIVIFNFTVDGQTITSFKRVIATSRVALNTNPTGTALLLNGAPFAGSPQKGDTLSLSTSTPESYDYINVDNSTETRLEDYQVAWYISEGEFNKPKSDVAEEVELTKDTPITTYLIIGIVRDERGGVKVVRQKIL